ncbi:Acyl-CoA N-acyltransferase [Ascosphaera apis ARSEF 7405]|uniref:Acyl-CoA N-acyltransferase n=1 Tax=Ascosphaera apis ARSEF 7405 TaxID=392613 RepID=A0A167XZR3_9EURO|nr:Acyl-CoA N-acyltransferase [Ascosphaera apis ARSEF 7405]
MPYVVEVATKEDIPALVQTTYEAFTNPFYKIFYVFFPHSCQSGTENELKEYNEAGGEIVWNKVYDSDDPEKAIVGGAKWYFYQRSPHEPRPGQEQTFIHPKDREADWYSKGSVAREFSNQVLQQHNAPRIQWTEGQPHCYLHLAFTASEHRRKGVASKYLQWGVDKADELGLESYLEASTLGAPAYRKFGFIDGPIVKAEPKMPEDYTDEQKAEWEELAKSQLPSASLLMWRPVKGEFVEGKTVPPWSR